jgi:hypothetical protein
LSVLSVGHENTLDVIAPVGDFIFLWGPRCHFCRYLFVCLSVLN